MGRPAVFLDRDGTLSQEVGYVNDLSRFELYPYSAAAVRALNRAGLLAIVATNQAGVARGYFPESLIHEVHDALRARLSEGGARLDGVYVCMHHPSVGEPPYRQECDCRKPKPGMLLRAAAELDVDLRRSYVIGDREGDLKLAWSVGARAVLVRSGYGRGELRWNAERWSRQPDLVAEHLLEAVARICEEARA
jgi:D-glycero-D-manno-heptose 1,7-bisphosphate phosphatase